MQVTSKDHLLKVMALTRFHFVSGMPHAGARYLMDVLAQNSRFATSKDSAAAGVFAEMQQSLAKPHSALAQLDRATRVAVQRNVLDAVHHARPMESVVLDHSPDWLSHLDALAEALPLSRFIVMVRDPACIAAEMARDSGRVAAPRDLMGPKGAIGAPMAQIEAAMNSPIAERLLLIDHDRLLSDPSRVLAALYGVLREPLFQHDTRALPKPDVAAPQLRGWRRRVVSLTARKSKPVPQTPKPLWQRSSGTAATLLLREAG